MKKVAAVAFIVAACGGAQQQGPSAPPSGTAAGAAAPASTAAAAPAEVPHVAQVDVPPSIRALLSAPDRPDKDRELDAGRRPDALLAFAGIGPGMRVAEIGAGLGYTTELLARAVGPSGAVFSENNKFIVQRFADKPWGERLAKPALKNVVRVDREFDDPLPPEAKNLDAVFSVLIYHDTVWMGADRDKMNRAVLDALKPGGEYVIVDHSAKEGSGVADVQTLHRIDQRAVVDEVTRVGFRLAAVGDFLRNASDTRDWNDAPMVAADRRGKSDRFVLKFVR
ncbi:MAG TPA: SAM-dependent methyltransferase [Polyangiaceae bacterium]|nr:SAM-dependent methyltransferase [Polyangiaceae bacterium]